MKPHSYYVGYVQRHQKILKNTWYQLKQLCIAILLEVLPWISKNETDYQEELGLIVQQFMKTWGTYKRNNTQGCIH